MHRLLNGFEVLNKFFDELFTNNPKVVAFGEDLGFIGDVNQGFSGLQQKHGDQRIFDTGIRELTIMGQGIGLAMRGLTTDCRNSIPRLSVIWIAALK